MHDNPSYEKLSQAGAGDNNHPIKIGVCCAILVAMRVAQNLKEAVEIAEQLGFDAVELSMAHISQDMNARLAIVSTCQRGGLFITGLHHILPDEFSIFDDAGKVRSDFAKYLCRAAQTAALFQAPMINMGIGATRRLPPGMSRELACGRFMDAVAKILPEVGAENIRLSVEIISSKTADFFNTVSEATYWLGQLNSEYVGITCDTFQCLRQGVEPADEIQMGLPWLLNVHLSERGRRTPGTGDLDFGRILSILHHGNYHGSVSIELKPASNSYLGTTNPVEDLQLGQQYLRYLRETLS